MGQVSLSLSSLSLFFLVERSVFETRKGEREKRERKRRAAAAGAKVQKEKEAERSRRDTFFINSEKREHLSGERERELLLAHFFFILDRLANDFNGES